MQWLLYLACPLMMIFCMMGVFGGNKNKKTDDSKSNVSQQELQNLQIKMADLMEENQKLAMEVQVMKESPSNGVEMSEKKSKRVIS